MVDGEPWFVLADLCKVLGLSSPHKVYERVAGDAKGRSSVPTPGGVQEMTVVSEPGMYEVVIRSDKPEAAAFRSWVFHEVLPTIRKTGAYVAPSRRPSCPNRTTN
ncbi:BRO-N domain-containing protein [Mycolicibacillus trivialis]